MGVQVGSDNTTEQIQHSRPLSNLIKGKIIQK